QKIIWRYPDKPAVLHRHAPFPSAPRSYSTAIHQTHTDHWLLSQSEAYRQTSVHNFYIPVPPEEILRIRVCISRLTGVPSLRPRVSEGNLPGTGSAPVPESLSFFPAPSLPVH